MKTKKSLLASSIALILCFAMLLGSTFAWFTDVVTSAGNKIQSGSLKLDLKVLTEVESLDGTTYYEWVSIKNDRSPLFNYENWEPGYTDVTILMVENLGTLALKWEARFASDKPLSALADVIDVYVKPGVTSYPADRADLEANGWEHVGALKDFVNKLSETTYGYLDGVGSGGTTSATLGIALKMRESAGNEYQNLSLGEFDIRIVATQAMKENDSFGNDYDEDAQWPVFKGSISASAPVTNVGGTLASDTTVSSTDGKISATLPAGVTLDNGTDKVTLSVSEKTQSEAGILSAPGEVLSPLDVHIEGVAEGNTTPIPVTIQALLPTGLNAGNYKLYHVENGLTVEMTPRAAGQDPTHNTFDYDPATGDVTLYLASFSEVMVQANKENKWEGYMDFSWYDYAMPNEEGVLVYKISNADQLAAFGAIVGGMEYDMKGNAIPYPQDSFEDRIVTLVADIYIGDMTDEDGRKVMFYPIGYYNSTGKYTRVTGESVSSYFNPFMGTFDGCGHTISSFYQNTWEAFGDYNDGYSGTPNYNRDGFGLFGYVLGNGKNDSDATGGIIRNLTVNNFSSDGEFTTTGSIAAYADGALFENISITYCNPRVYNIGNGGIVGCVGWYAKEADLKTTFKNVTVDNTNKITALWGSWDVACGGIVGQYYPTSGQTSAGTPANGGMHFENCHSSAVIDVYNDVCANYQYYAYRYSGILIGSVRENETINGHSYPKMDKITANKCTVHFGDWNDYYYCEIVANSLASYTHDHQMSRLTQVASVDTVNKTVTTLDGDTVAIPESGWAHYVVVTNKDKETGKWVHGDGSTHATCYHFINGVQHKHDVADASNPNINETVNGQTVLKEDKQLVYREFNNLVTGYGWGVTSMGLGDLEGVENLDEIIANEGESYEKFTAVNASGNDTKLQSNTPYRFDKFFAANSNLAIGIHTGTVTIAAHNKTADDKVTVEITRNKDNWEESTITFRGAGTITLTIQDYYFCNPTENTTEFTVYASFLDHTLGAFPFNDDFSKENSDTQANREFKTSGESAKYYVNVDEAEYFYIETDVKINSTLKGNTNPKIGFVAGTYNEKGAYVESLFYLDASVFTEYDQNGDPLENQNTNKWNTFRVGEQYNSENKIYSNPAYTLDEAITTGNTFKIALLRNGDEYHFFIKGKYAFTYIADEDSPLSEIGATNVGFFQNNVKATFSNYKVDRYENASKIPSGITNLIPSNKNEVSVTDTRGYIEFISDNEFTLDTRYGKKWDGNIYYSTSLENADDFSDWREWDGETLITSGKITSGNNNGKYIIRLSGLGNTYITGRSADAAGIGSGNNSKFENGWILNGNDIYCSGNIMTLLDSGAVQKGDAPVMNWATFAGLFAKCTALKSSPSLPETQLTASCYRYMFDGCTGLEEAPKLPATEMAPHCYNVMFRGCTSLVDAPDLPATKLALTCYGSMFSGCTKLETVSELPATVLEPYCYYSMFSGCSSLKEVPYLPATQLAAHCYNYMFYNKDHDDKTNAGTGIKISATYDEAKGYTTEYRIPVTNADVKADYSNYLEIGKDENNKPIYKYDYRTYPVSQMFTSTSGTYLPVNTDLFTEAHPDYGLGYLPSYIKVVGKHYVEFISDSEITITAPKNWKKIEYSTDTINWKEWDGTTVIKGNTIYLRGTGNTVITGDVTTGWTITGNNIRCNGNIEYLLDYQTVMAGGHPKMDSYCFKSMFKGCTGLVKAPELPSLEVPIHGYHSMFMGCTSLVNAPELPATKLNTTSYGSMFNGCTSLVNAPELPATTLAGWCYYAMFQGCTSLVNAPELPATTLAQDCYGYMFYGCTSLVNAPEQIPATTLTIRGCEYMFYGCTSLETVPELPATTLADRCYFWMFAGCTKLKEVPYLPATTLANHCYNHMFFNAFEEDVSKTQTATHMTRYTFPLTSTYIEEINSTFWPFGQMFDDNSAKAHIQEQSLYLPTYVTVVGKHFVEFVADSQITIIANSGKKWTTKIEYNIGEGWKEWLGEEITSLNKLILMRGTGNTVITGDKDTYGWTITGTNVNCNGNIEYLLDYQTVMAGGHPTMSNYCYRGLFYNCEDLVKAPELPATNLKTGCYYAMFRGTGITVAPELPATTLANGCYYNMFRECTSLTTAPVIPNNVTTANNCYLNMFTGCTNLTTPDWYNNWLASQS